MGSIHESLRRSCALVVLVVVALVLGATDAHADAAQDKAAAEVLFREGRKLFEAGDFKTACSRFSESHRLDPQMGTLINLALCHEKEGKLASAWAEFLEAAVKARAAGKSEQAKFAAKHAADLEPRLARLSVRADKPASGFVVTVNGTKVASMGTALPYDPGKVLVEASAPSRTPWSKEVDVAAGATNDVVVPELAPASASASSPSPSGDGSGPARPASAPGTSTDEKPSGGSGGSGGSLHTLGFVGIGVGAVGIAVGGVAGLFAVSKKGDLESDPGCPNRCADREGVDSYNTMRVVSSIGFIAGATLLAAGVVLLFAAPPSSKMRAQDGLRVAVTLPPRGAILRF